MILQPSYSLTLGSQLWTEQLLGIEVELELGPRLDVLSARLPASAPMSAAPGDEVVLTLGSGEKSEDVFSGTVASVSRDVEEIRLRALNGGGALARYRPAVTYEQVTAADVIESLCADVGVETDAVENGVELAFYVADPSRTAFEHVCRASAWGGAVVRFNAGNRLESIVVNASQAELALRSGREMLAVEQSELSSPQDSFVVTGESGSGSTSAPEILRPTTDFFAGNRPQGPGVGTVWSWEPALRTPQASATAGAAIGRAHASGQRPGKLTAFLQPDIRPGTVIELAELPGELSAGPFWVVGVKHRLSPDGALTTARFHEGGDAFDSAGLLGSLAGALGGVF
jgi:hypothetical protein